MLRFFVIGWLVLLCTLAYLCNARCYNMLCVRVACIRRTRDGAVHLRAECTQECSSRRRLRIPLSNSSANPRHIRALASLLALTPSTTAQLRHRCVDARRTPSDTSRICRPRPLHSHITSRYMA